MGMRAGVRLGRGLWVTGGGGLLATVLTLRLLASAGVFVVGLVAIGAAVVLCLVAELWVKRPAARRLEVLSATAGSVGQDAIKPVAGASPPLWGVYLLGGRAFSGRHPRRQQELRALYPDLADQLACVCVMPDSNMARKAARQMERKGFSTSELKRLFLPASQGTATKNLPVAEPEASGAVPGVEAYVVELDSTSKAQERIAMNKERDYTKYRFGGEVLGKGRLVLALVRRYVQDHPDVTFSMLREAFPDSLQSDSPLQFSPVQVVVARVSAIPDQENKRFFLGAGETLQLRDGEVAVSKEWNLLNIQNVLRRASELGYEVSVA